MTRSDVAFAVWLALLLPLSWLAPQRLWTPLCVIVNRAYVRLTPRATAAKIEQVRKLQGDRHGLPSPRLTVLYQRAGRMERYLQYLREFRPGGWDSRIEVIGSEHIDRALEDGRGGILWVGPLRHGYLVAKKGLCEAGYSVTHLSHVSHGLSRSRLGRPLNLVTTIPEERYLAERLVMTDGSELRHTRDLYARLRANGLVSITATRRRWGAREVMAPLLGGTAQLASGAPSLALASGAALLPVFALKRTYERFEVIVEPALAIDRSGDRHAAVDAAVRAYVARLEHYVMKHPHQYIDWW